MSQDMNKSYRLKVADRNPKWIVIDAKDQVLGRLATKIADILRGKNRPTYTPHTDSGDYVVVINADAIALTGDKWKGKIYDWYTGWKGGYKTITAGELMKKHPTMLVEQAVRRMLPKSTLSRSVFKKLKVYAGPEHPHKAQISE
jgi:large subunit ribosomal protein L13